MPPRERCLAKVQLISTARKMHLNLVKVENRTFPSSFFPLELGFRNPPINLLACVGLFSRYFPSPGLSVFKNNTFP